MIICGCGAKDLFHVHWLDLCFQVAENAVLFVAYGLCQKAVAATVGKSDVSSLSPLQNAMSGFFAAFFSTLVLCPTELVKCKMQAMREMNAGELAAKRMYRLL